MSREAHVRFWERVGVRLPRATRFPLYRQSEIYARHGVELERSTLADWVGGASHLLAPLVEALRRYVFDCDKLHADDTPVPVLAPGMGKTKTGRLWTYVRDDRPAGDTAAPAVWFAYSPDRKGEHPQRHLRDFHGTLQADAYAGFNQLYEDGRIREAACWAHVRRKFYDLNLAHHSPIAAEAIERIAGLYAIESEIRGRPAEERMQVRQARARPLLESLRAWRLPFGECRLRFTPALSSSPGHAPTHEESFSAEGKVAALAPTSAMICCAESTPSPGTTASLSTES